MAAIQTHRRSLLGSHVPPAPLVIPYPEDGLVGYYDASMARNVAVSEIGGAVKVWHNLAQGPNRLGNMSGTAYWRPDADGVPFLYFDDSPDGLAIGGFALPAGYSLTIVCRPATEPNFKAAAFQGGNGLAFLFGARDTDPNETAMLLYTGYGGNTSIKFFSGQNYRDAGDLPDGARLVATATRAGVGGGGFCRVQFIAPHYYGDTGFAGLGTLTTGGQGLAVALILVYDHQLNEGETLTVNNIAASRHAIT